jgi:hypothetical protein
LLLAGLILITIAITQWYTFSSLPPAWGFESNPQIYAFLSIGIGLLIGIGITAFATRKGS